MRVICKHCEHEKDADECWCVIDTVKRERYFECKVSCITIPQRADRIGNGIRDLEQKAEEIQEALVEIDTAVDDWMHRIPRKTWVEWFKSFFGLSEIRYIKVKTN